MFPYSGQSTYHNCNHTKSFFPFAAHIRVYRVKEINTAIDIQYIRHIGSVVTNNLIITSSPDHIRIKTCQLLNTSKSMPIKYET